MSDSVHSSEASLQVARRLYEITTRGDFDSLTEILAPDIVDHGVGDEDLTGEAAVRAALSDFRKSFPDMAFTLEDVIASGNDGEKVTVRWQICATHTEPFQGIPATGRTVRLKGIDILRIADGKIAERWGASDELGLLQQLVDRRQGERRTVPPAVVAPADRRRGPDRRRS